MREEHSSVVSDLKLRREPLDQLVCGLQTTIRQAPEVQIPAAE